MSGNVRLAPGAVFAGDYKVVRAISESELRAVYVAEQVSTGKDLALKIMSPDLVADQAARDAFVAEVRIGGKIATEHVVDVRAAGIDKETGFPWLAMELLAGQDLARSLADHTGIGPMPEWDEVLTQMLHGLAAVHAAGFAHGSLHPETVFLAVPGIGGEPYRVELLELGIPRAKKDEASVNRLEWLAPEQLRGEKATPQSDVWTGALLAFRMVTGKHYWKAASPGGDADTVRKEILEGTLPTASIRAKDLGAKTTPSASFDAWFARCLNRDAAARFPNAGEALEGAAELLTEVSEVSAADIQDDESSRAVSQPAVVAPKKGPPPLPPMVQAIADNPRPAIFAIVALIAVALGIGFGLGALRKPPTDKARAKAMVWARGGREEAEKACTGGDAQACHGLGLQHLYGLKSARDDAKAAQLFQKACDGGDQSACGSLAARYLNGEGVKEDRTKAASLYKQACDAGEAVSCADLAEMYQTGNGVPRDEAQSKVLYEKACKAGFTEVCK
jgi:hypothetical protein